MTRPLDQEKLIAGLIRTGVRTCIEEKLIWIRSEIEQMKVHGQDDAGLKGAILGLLDAEIGDSDRPSPDGGK